MGGAELVARLESLGVLHGHLPQLCRNRADYRRHFAAAAVARGKLRAADVTEFDLSAVPPQPPPPATPRQSLPCVHLGERVGVERCGGCAGNVRRKVFACAHPTHGPATTLAKCRGCAGYAARPA